MKGYLTPPPHKKKSKIKKFKQNLKNQKSKPNSTKPNIDSSCAEFLTLLLKKFEKLIYLCLLTTLGEIKHLTMNEMSELHEPFTCFDRTQFSGIAQVLLIFH